MPVVQQALTCGRLPAVLVGIAAFLMQQSSMVQNMTTEMHYSLLQMLSGLAYHVPVADPRLSTGLLLQMRTLGLLLGSTSTGALSSGGVSLQVCSLFAAEEDTPIGAVTCRL